MRFLASNISENAELLIEGTRIEFNRLSNLISQSVSNPLILEGELTASKFYPVTLRLFSLMPEKSTDGKFAISVDQESLVMSGDKQAFLRLSKFFHGNWGNDPTKKYHIHLDYFEGVLEDWLLPTKHSLVICANPET